MITFDYILIEQHNVQYIIYALICLHQINNDTISEWWFSTYYNISDIYDCYCYYNGCCWCHCHCCVIGSGPNENEVARIKNITTHSHTHTHSKEQWETIELCNQFYSSYIETHCLSHAEIMLLGNRSGYRPHTNPNSVQFSFTAPTTYATSIILFSYVPKVYGVWSFVCLCIVYTHLHVSWIYFT